MRRGPAFLIQETNQLDHDIGSSHNKGRIDEPRDAEV